MSQAQSTIAQTAERAAPISAPGRSKNQGKGRQILEAAAGLFMRDGYSTVSMEQIAKAAGVAKQTVYSHYGSKGTLFSAAIEQKCEDYEIGHYEADNERPVPEFLREFIQRFSDLVSSDAGISIHRVCISEADKRSDLSELFWNAGPLPIIQRLTAYLKDQVRRGSLDIVNIHFAADQLLFMVKSDVHTRGVLGLATEEARRDLPAYLDSCLDVFMKAYGATGA
ncbi:MAG: TetR/AcrR family transcriptional repressor of mexJK operon [Paracoccaceae bacterium]